MAPVDTQYRQGDILLVVVDALPADAEPIASATGPLALVPSAPGPGSHLLPRSPNVRVYGRTGGDGAIEWLEISGGGITVAHPEHAPIRLEPGIWHVIRQREYDPAAGHRRVAD
jgi:hypothetical protein